VADPVHVAAAVDSMKGLNRQAVRLVQGIGVRACTDITGFALLGHGYEMAERSNARLRLHLEELPFLNGAKRYAEDNLFPGGSCRNRDAYERWVDFAPGISEEMQLLLFTPETSGGLLVAVPPERLGALTALFADEGQPCWVVGQVVEGEGIEVI
jgi:selenide,water dikinase